MFPMRALRLAIGTSLSDTAPLDQVADANIIALVIAPFALDELLVVSDLTYADFDGSTPLAVELGTQQVANDPATGEQIVTLVEPLGGWRWETTGLTNLPQTVYGYALLTEASAELLAVEPLPAPITLSEVGQEINIGKARFRINLEPMS